MNNQFSNPYMPYYSQPAQPTSNYVTKEELNDILKGYLAKPTPKVEVKADE